MKVSHQILTLTILIICISCNINPPVLDSAGGGSSVSLLRNLKLKCKDLEACHEQSDQSYEAIARYTNEECKDIDNNYEIIASASGVVNCSEISCQGLIKEFKTIDDQVPTVAEGKYTVFTFIDFNQNESIDFDEPYFCSSEVGINQPKRLTNIEVEFKRLYGE